MATVVFYEKPGCGGNARQKALLAAAGHRVEARDLLRHPWLAVELRIFFGARPVAEWFNAASPRVKSGEVDPTAFDEAGALAAMLADPLLIRRPLLQVGEARRAGFDPAAIDAWIGLGGRAVDPAIDRCPKPGAPNPCAPPGSAPGTGGTDSPL